MSDLDIGWAVNDADALDSLDKIEKKGGKSASFMEKEFDQASNKLRKTFIGIGNIGQAAMLGIGGAAAYGVKAIKEYAKNSDDGADAIADFEAANDRMARNVGRDLVNVTRDLTSVVNVIEDLRQSVKDPLAIGIRWTGQALGFLDAADGGIDKVEEAQRLEENMSKSVRAMQARMEMMRQFAQQRARMNDDPIEAARIEGEQLRMTTAKRLNELKMTPQDRSQVERSMEDIITRMQQDAALEMDKRTRDLEAQLVAQDRLTNNEREQFDASAEQLRIDNLRLDGQNKLADTMEIQLEFAKRRRDIERSSLSADDKKVRLEELAGLEQFQLSHLKEKMGSITTSQIQGGLLGGAALQALVFGGTRSKKDETLERIGNDQVKLLGRIADAVERDTVAVLA